MSEVFLWLKDVYTNIDAGNTDDAMDMLFDRLDDMFLTGMFGVADALLSHIDVDRLDTTMCVAVLATTFCAKDRLKARAHLVRRVEKRLKKIAPNRAERLMRGRR